MLKSYLVVFFLAVSFSSFAQEQKTISDIIDDEVWSSEELESEAVKKKQEEEKKERIKTQKADIYDSSKKGEVLFEEQKYQESVTLFIEAAGKARNYRFRKKEFDLLLKIVGIYKFLKDDNNHLKYLHRLEELFENYKRADKGMVYAELSYAYFSKDLDLSRTYIEKALYENVKSKSRLAENYYNLEIIFKKLGLLDESKKAHVKFKEYEKFAEKDFFKLSQEKQSREFLKEISLPEGKNLLKAQTANIQILNKINGFTYLYEIPTGSKIVLKNLEIIVHNCFKSDPRDLPENMALLKIKDHFQEDESKKDNVVFYGWMLSSSPSLNALENRIYDVRLVECLTKKL
jgi:hypothetical protein